MRTLKNVHVLQLGTEDYSQFMPVAQCAKWHYEPSFEKLDINEFDVSIIGRRIEEDELNLLRKYTKAYSVFIMDSVEIGEYEDPIRVLLESRKGQVISGEQLSTLLQEDLYDYFSKSYGERDDIQNLNIAQGFSGTVKWDGYQGVELYGDYGEKMTQIAFWRNTLPIDLNQSIEYWLEYNKDPSVEISMEIVQFPAGTVSEIDNVWTFSEQQLNDVVHITNDKRDGNFFVSLKAKGSGKLKIIALHDRHSRRGKGLFIPGGKRLVTSDREEVFYYFDPGNMRPPLNVYFSGYKTKEGFQCYNMMRKLGYPFLLIAEARLEGGCAYLGSEEYENLINKVIKQHMDELNFDNSQVIMSGLSMGTVGAMYYGSDIHPHSVIVGKPLASFGNVAANERINRPGGFATSLDVLKKLCGSMDQQSVEQLNNRFWDKFRNTNWSGTRIAVAYMIEDDYDNTAYNNLLASLKDSGVQIYGKGLHGRHNDDTAGITSWFVSQYKKIIENEFHKKSEQIDLW